MPGAKSRGQRPPVAWSKEYTAGARTSTQQTPQAETAKRAWGEAVQEMLAPAIVLLPEGGLEHLGVDVEEDLARLLLLLRGELGVHAGQPPHLVAVVWPPPPPLPILSQLRTACARAEGGASRARATEIGVRKEKGRDYIE